MIKTNNLRLLPCTRKYIEAFQRGKQALADLLHVTIPDSWPQFPEAFTLSDDSSKAAPQSVGWSNYLFIHLNEGSLVGSGGFTGMPDESGTAEIGYEIASEFWNRGFATEAVHGFLTYAFAHNQAQIVMAHTLANKNASNSVLQKVGMKFVGEVDSEEVGKIWRWQICRENYKSA